MVQSQAAAMLAWPRALLLDRPWCNSPMMNDDDDDDDDDDE